MILYIRLRTQIQYLSHFQRKCYYSTKNSKMCYYNTKNSKMLDLILNFHLCLNTYI